MIKFVCMIRGGFKGTNNNGEAIEKLIADAGVQDNLFLLDIKHYSFELMGDEVAFSEFVKRFLGTYSCSIIRSEMDRATNTVYTAFGKIMDGQLLSRQSEVAKKLF